MLSKSFKPSKYTEIFLKSSALGDNLIYYYDMEGRVVIDLMKVIQRDYKLSQYSLNNVSKYFLKEKVTKL
jgi:DNA polymerase elongation subunit (family B)